MRGAYKYRPQYEPLLTCGHPKSCQWYKVQADGTLPENPDSCWVCAEIAAHDAQLLATRCNTLADDANSVLSSKLERATDLIRYARHFLHNENAITDEEYAEIVADSDGRVARLEGYDKAIAKVAATHKARIERLLKALKAWEHWYSVDSTEFNRDIARSMGLTALEEKE